MCIQYIYIYMIALLPLPQGIYNIYIYIYIRFQMTQTFQYHDLLYDAISWSSILTRIKETRTGFTIPLVAVSSEISHTGPMTKEQKHYRLSNDCWSFVRGGRNLSKRPSHSIPNPTQYIYIYIYNHMRM